jgi:pyrimidine operon attenuation protein / uracil phosphoribosyltransferase
MSDAIGRVLDDRPGRAGERQIMSAEDIRRAVIRIGHEIVEKHGRPQQLALVGIERRGAILAGRVAGAIDAIHAVRLPVGSIDITPYRDDRPLATASSAATGDPPSLPFDPTSTTIVLVDDVLFTGRTIRAALQALTAHGRPAAVRVAVLVDRGHRELPIRADHVGRNIPTARHEDVSVRLVELDGGEDEVVVLHGPEPGPSGGAGREQAAGERVAGEQARGDRSLDREP